MREMAHQLTSYVFQTPPILFIPMPENRHFCKIQLLFLKNTTAGPQEMKNAGFFAGIFRVLLKFFYSTF